MHINHIEQSLRRLIVVIDPLQRTARTRGVVRRLHRLTEATFEPSTDDLVVVVCARWSMFAAVEAWPSAGVVLVPRGTDPSALLAERWPVDLVRRRFDRVCVALGNSTHCPYLDAVRRAGINSDGLLISDSVTRVIVEAA